jgi:uncharacterized cupredoxin-like copper-binding protein
VEAVSQTEQRIDVTIKGFTFVVKQVPLQLSTPTVIVLRNEDQVRHDFGSPVFHGAAVRVERDGVTTYGTGIQGVYLDPARSAEIRFMIERPGRYEFRCSIHPEMKGEILLLNAGTV